jgi:hypothetical protein
MLTLGGGAGGKGIVGDVEDDGRPQPISITQ